MIAAAIALVLAGCGTGGGEPASSGHTATRTVIRTATPTSATAGSSTTPSTTTASTATTGAQRSASSTACVAADLQLRYLGGEGATGHGELGFALRNRSNATCHTFGYPGVLLLDRDGGALPTTPTHTTDDFFGHTTEQELTVAPGASVSFRLGVVHVSSSGGSSGCTTAAGLQVIAPDDTATLRVTIPGGGAAECGGTVSVSPLQPGTSAVAGQ